MGASRFTALYGRQGCILTRTVESNQGGRFDGNEFVADLFRSGAVSFENTGKPFLGAFPLILYISRGTKLSGKRTPCPGVNPHLNPLFTQIKSYSPVVNIESFRLLIALAAKLKLNVNFFVVKTAYLYGDLEETVYVLPPPGYEKLIGDKKFVNGRRVFMVRHSQVESGM
ncbi:retrovirus-related Pol polyprotein from transposon TNT 1-94 [Trichonephila clavipes]|nr:retrovirus-related Pol polyprotein from transposon TNT 1-94 [Trichonephila clavipes]